MTTPPIHAAQTEKVRVSFPCSLTFSLFSPFLFLVHLLTLASVFLLFIGSLSFFNYKGREEGKKDGRKEGREGGRKEVRKEGRKGGRKERRRKKRCRLLCPQLNRAIVSLCLLTRILLSHLISSVFHSVDIYENTMVSSK